jgi:hypothetical protein
MVVQANDTGRYMKRSQHAESGAEAITVRAESTRSSLIAAARKLNKPSAHHPDAEGVVERLCV